MIRTTHIRRAMPHQFRRAILSRRFALARAEAVGTLADVLPVGWRARIRDRLTR